MRLHEIINEGIKPPVSIITYEHEFISVNKSHVPEFMLVIMKCHVVSIYLSASAFEKFVRYETGLNVRLKDLTKIVCALVVIDNEVSNSLLDVKVNPFFNVRSFILGNQDKSKPLTL